MTCQQDAQQTAPAEGWLNLHLLGTFEGITSRAVKKRIAQNLYPPDKVRKVTSVGFAGWTYEVHWTALSPDGQRAYLARRGETLEQKVSTVLATQTAEPLQDAPQAEVPAETLQRASGKALRQAAHRAGLVEAFRACQTKAEKVSFAKRHHLPLSSIYRWSRRYDGTAASLLAPPKAGRRMSTTAAAIRQAAVDLYLRPERPTPEQVLHALRTRLGEATPSRATIYRWLTDEQVLGGRGKATYIRWGEKVYRDTCEPIRRRDWSRIPVNGCWVGDHHELDLLVIRQDGTIGRPWLTAWQDGHSRAIVGYTINPQPNSLEIGLALRAGILPTEDEPFQGIPAKVYVDNGKDYRAKLLNGSTVPVFRQSHEDPIWGLFGHLGIATHFCEPYHGKSKPIERFFGTLESGWLCLMKGYCGRSPQHRPEHLAADVKATQEWLQSNGARGERRLMTWWEMEIEVSEAIRAYNRRPHSQIGWNPATQSYYTPAEVYLQGLGATVRLPAREVMDVLILPSATRQVRQDGIHLHKTLYWHPDLAPLIGQEVEVRYHPRDLREVLVLRKGAFAAWAQAQTGAAPFAETEEETEELRAFLAGNARARKEYRERRAALLAANPLAAMVPGTRELAAAGQVIPMPHVTGYDRSVRQAARAKRAMEKRPNPPTHAQSVAVGELIVWEFQRQAQAHSRKEES